MYAENFPSFLPSPFAIHSEEKEKEKEEDRISKLEDQILISILSLLSIKDAASTCILSKGLNYLWTYTLRLNFHSTTPLFDLVRYPHLRQQASSSYVGWVNHVLNSHKSLTLDEFRISFVLDNSYSGDIDRWIEFAIKKRVKSLEIQLGIGAPPPSKDYIFPEKIYVYIKSPCGLSSIKSLKHLSLTYVNVTGELLQHFLSHCPLLEKLSVDGSEHLLNFKVSGLSLRLKFLAISRCICLKSVEICAPNLVSFDCYGVRKRITIMVKYAPSLLELSVGELADHVHYGFLSFSSYFSKLKTLSLFMNMRFQENMLPPQLPEFISLQSLTLTAYVNEDESLLDWTSLIKASPSLQRFTLQLIWIKKACRKRRKITKCPHQSLKVVEMVGFLGRTVDTELGLYLIENSVALEEIIIDCFPVSLIGPQRDYGRRDHIETNEKKEARNSALELARRSPSAAKLVFV